jgi:hypothetical protein
MFAIAVITMENAIQGSTHTEFGTKPPPTEMPKERLCAIVNTVQDATTDLRSEARK